MIKKIRSTSDNLVDAIKIIERNAASNAENESFINMIKDKFIEIKNNIKTHKLSMTARNDVKIMRNKISTLNKYYGNLKTIEKNIIYSNNISGKVIGDFINDILDSNIISNILIN